MTKKHLCFLILDGLGEGENNIANPFRFTKTPNFDYFRKNYPFCLLTASGISVGLPYNQPGTCESGHLTIGTGTIYYKNLPRINLSIEKGDFYKNEKLLKIFEHCQNYNSRLHLIGLLSKSISKTDINHLYAILNLAKNLQFENIYLHLFTDGIDSPPKSALDLIQKLYQEIKKQNYSAKIATLCGRVFALDETQNYTLRTKKGFLLITEGIGILAKDPVSYLKEKYKESNFNDSILEPVIFDKNGILKDGDALLFFHFENKSIYQLANAFLNPNFQEFKRPTRKNLYLASLTKYLDLDYPVIFEEQKILINLSRILAENKLTQLKIIDSSRETLFRYYFNGFIVEEHFGETYKILPPFELEKEKLEKQTEEFFNLLILTVKEGDFNFILANLPVFDILGHTGDFKSAIYFIEKIDKFLGELYDFLIKTDYFLIITSDHGNIEKMFEPTIGTRDTFHNLSPVPFYLIDKERKKEKSNTELNFYSKKILGSLIDIAPTILEIFQIPKPKEFEGRSLLTHF